MTCKNDATSGRLPIHAVAKAASLYLIA